MQTSFKLPEGPRRVDGPLRIPWEEARKLEEAILTLKPFAGQSWSDAVENYLILRWMLGLETATAQDIVDGLRRARFSKMADRSDESCRGTVYRVLQAGKFRKFRITKSPMRRWIRYHPKQYAWHPPT